jgi:hypothetical protein
LLDYRDYAAGVVFLRVFGASDVAGDAYAALVGMVQRPERLMVVIAGVPR